MDDTAPQDPATDANPSEADPETHVETSSPHVTPSSPVVDPLRSTAHPPSPAAKPPSLAANPPNPAKDNINPLSPAKDDDDVVVTGTAYTAQATQLLYQSILPRMNLLLWTKENGRPIYPTMLIFLLKIFISDS